MKRIITLVLTLAALLVLTVTACADTIPGTAKLTITPTDTKVSGDTATVTYSVTVTPPEGKELGVFSVQLQPSDGMTLAKDFYANGKQVITYGDGKLSYSEVKQTGYFATYEYTPQTGYFAAVGTTPERRMSKEATILTIQATMPANKDGTYTLKPVDAVVSTTCGSDDVAAHYECTVCGKLFSDAAGKNETTIDKLTTKKAHTLVKVDAVAATCTTNGTKEHYKCTNESCGRLFTDAAGKNETTADKLVIPAAHKLVKTDAKAATCTTPGNKEYWTCDVCKKVFSDAAGKNKIALADTTIAALGHKLTKTDKVDSTCTATGHEAYWTCSRCKGIFADEQGATATTLDNLTIAKKAHTSGDYVTNATEHFKTCSVCGTEIEKSREKHTFVKDDTTGVETCKCGYAIGGKVDENHQHAAGNDWFRDENNHWHKCTDPKCTAHVGEAKHDFKTVSTTKDGNKTTTVEKCETCGYVKTTTVDNTPVTPVNPSKPGRPSGTKTVQSGKTFDAGVGVYVGLSILSLTGSAVVIGKKRKTR